MRELPKQLEPYKKTPVFDQDSIPPGLLKAHATKHGTWGKIEVVEGELLYRILQPVIEEVVLTIELSGIVEPTVEHEVVPLGNVKFYVEFYK